MTTPTIPSNDRKCLRYELRCRRRALSAVQQKQSAQGLYLQLVQHPWFRRATDIAFYLANDGEISPHLLVQEAQRRKKNIYLPVVSLRPAKRMVFQRISEATRWRRNRFGIVEPVADAREQRPPMCLDLICLLWLALMPKAADWEWGLVFMMQWRLAACRYHTCWGGAFPSAS